MSKLRMISKDVAKDYNTLTASSSVAGFPVTNIVSDKKWTTWRTDNLLNPLITFTFTNDVLINGLAIPYTNMTVGSTIEITGKSGGVTQFTTGSLDAVRWVHGLPSKVTDYPFNGSNSFAVYFNPGNLLVDELLITLTNSGNTDGFIEVGRIIFGEYWQPAFNTEYGLSLATEDTTEVARTGGGSLASRGVRFKRLTFALNWLSTEDRGTFEQIRVRNGKYSPLWVSLFPEHEDPHIEALHQIYGRFAELSPIAFANQYFYSTSVDVEEL